MGQGFGGSGCDEPMGQRAERLDGLNPAGQRQYYVTGFVFECLPGCGLIQDQRRRHSHPSSPDDSETSIYTASCCTDLAEGGMPEMPPTIGMVNVSPALLAGFLGPPGLYLSTPGSLADSDMARPIVSSR